MTYLRNSEQLNAKQHNLRIALRGCLVMPTIPVGDIETPASEVVDI